MDLSNTPASPTRHDGWSPARRVQFLESLAQHGSVRAACARVGLSREAAYRLRRREPPFARAWAAAQILAREPVGDALGSRAIDGIEEDVWYRGEWVGTRRRYDTRLLLAHMARLDKLAEDERAVADSARFDELLACVAGEALPEELTPGPGELPISREIAGQMMGELAEEDATDEDDAEALRRGAAEGAALWDAWFAGACEAVDRLLAEPAAGLAAADHGTLSTVSTSAPEGATPVRYGEGVPPQGRGGPSSGGPAG